MGSNSTVGTHPRVFKPVAIRPVAKASGKAPAFQRDDQHRFEASTSLLRHWSRAITDRAAGPDCFQIGTLIAKDIAQDFLARMREAGCDAFYLIPPILKGGVRDYETAQAVIASVRG